MLGTVQELAEGVENALCLQSHTLPEFLCTWAADRTAAESFHGPGCPRERPAAAKFALAQCINGRPMFAKWGDKIPPSLPGARWDLGRAIDRWCRNEIRFPAPRACHWRRER